MKFNRINRMLLVLLLTSGLELSLTTCTNQGKVVLADEVTCEELVEDTVEDISEEISHYQR